jgi:hypothetical protein
MGFSYFPMELGPIPIAWAKTTGNLIWHRSHTSVRLIHCLHLPEEKMCANAETREATSRPWRSQRSWCRIWKTLSRLWTDSGCRWGLNGLMPMFSATKLLSKWRKDEHCTIEIMRRKSECIANSGRLLLSKRKEFQTRSCVTQYRVILRRNDVKF